MGTCVKCGVEMKDGARYCKECGKELRGDASMKDKKARVMNREKTWVKPIVIAAAVVLVAAAGFGFTQYRASRMGGRPMFPPHRDASARVSNATIVTAQNGDIRIPLKSVEDGNSHFFSYASAGGKTITFIVMKAEDGSIRTAFDACVACNHAKLGYRQEGSHIVCNNCGMGFTAGEIGQQTGGCNPIPVEKAMDGQMLVLKAKDLDAGVQYF